MERFERTLDEAGRAHLGTGEIGDLEDSLNHSVQSLTQGLR